jgi:vacuolar-type H+-ATPase subunit H
MTTQAEEHYPDKQSAKIQSAIASLADMESRLDELNNQVADMKRRLVSFAETQAEQAKAEIIEKASQEAQTAMDAVRNAAQSEADAIVAKGSSDTEALRRKIGGKIDQAVDIIVKSVQS